MEKFLTLAIDDDPLVLRSIVAALKVLGGECVACRSWNDAEAALRSSNSVEIIITDLNMPKHDGFAVLREVRKMFPEEGPRVVVVTGDVDRDRITAIKRAGFDGHLLKPYTLKQLKEMLEGLLDSSV